MKKEEFLRALEKSLSGLPREDIEERLQFYSESIDDRVDEGKTEEEAINDIGSVDEITNQIIKETPLKKIVKEKRIIIIYLLMMIQACFWFTGLSVIS